MIGASLFRCVVVALAASMVGAASCADSTQGRKLATITKTPVMRTHCIGRLLIDLPDGFEQTLGSDLDLTYGLDKNFRTIKIQILRRGAATNAFEGEVSKRTAELSARPSAETPTKSMLASVRQVNANTTLIRGHEEPPMRGYFRSQVIAIKEGTIAAFVADIFKRDTPEAVEAKALDVATRTSVMNSPIAPVRGACFGALVIDAGQDGESFTVSFQSTQWPDVTVSIHINSLVAEPGESLLRRWDSKSDMLGTLGFKSTTLRRGKLQISGRSAEELLSQGKENGRGVRHFTAEVVRTGPASFAAPQLSVDLSMGGQLRSGEYVDPSLSEEDALAWWDAIVKSIRLRPGAL